jgi:hypothetical protein
MNNGIVSEAGKVGTSAVEAMKSVPLAIALLLVNCAFLGFCGWILSIVASNASERNTQQMGMIADLVHEIRDCRQGPRSQNYTPVTKPMILKMLT